jgi:hypothetical protein
MPGPGKEDALMPFTAPFPQLEPVLDHERSQMRSAAAVTVPEVDVSALVVGGSTASKPLDLADRPLDSLPGPVPGLVEAGRSAAI